MPTFEVQLSKPVTLRTTVTVEAEDEDEAAELAEEVPADWTEDDDGLGPVYVDEVEEVSP